MNILEATKDPNLFRGFLADKNDSMISWRNWSAALRCLYGLNLPRRARQLINDCTGRDALQMPSNGFETALFLTGRRSGKSRMAAVIAAYESALAGHDKKLDKGEMGLLPVISPTRKQSRIVKGYIRSIFADTPLLQREIVSEDKDGFYLRNGIRIEILAGDWRSVRGYTLVAAIVDEAAFFGLDAESKVKSDTELMRALKPALATTQGRLIAISSPYAQRGWTYSAYKRNFGNNSGKTLVWNSLSRVMNPTLKQSIVDDALAEDLASAKAEYLGEFRDDVAIFLPRDVVEAAVVSHRQNLLARSNRVYQAFVDVSGGRKDDATLAIAHRNEDDRIVVDCLKIWRPPFNPTIVIGQMADVLREYRIRRVTGDNYAGEFCAGAFKANRINYQKCELNKSHLYLELLPRLCSGEFELPDDAKLINQLVTLERKTRSGGRDIVDHATSGHDDAANAVAGVVYISSRKKLKIGAF